MTVKLANGREVYPNGTIGNILYQKFLNIYTWIRTSLGFHSTSKQNLCNGTTDLQTVCAEPLLPFRLVFPENQNAIFGLNLKTVVCIYFCQKTAEKWTYFALFKMTELVFESQASI